MAKLHTISYSIFRQLYINPVIWILWICASKVKKLFPFSPLHFMVLALLHDICTLDGDRILHPKFSWKEVEIEICIYSLADG